MPIVPFFRPAGRALRLAAALVAAAFSLVLAQTPSAADGFDPNVDGNVFAVVAQPDGRLLIGGQFTAVGGITRNNLARLNPDGTVDATFNPNPNGPVRALVVQPNGAILLGGDFTTLQPGGAGATTTRSLLARLNADGSIDAGFNPNLGGDIQPQVHALALMPSGQIVAGGTFTKAGAFDRKYLARFDAGGALDRTFDPNPNGFVLALVAHVEGKVVVGGGFTSIWPAGDAVPSGRNRIARLNANGTIDSEFNPNANNAVTALAVQRDGKVLLGGTFTTLQPPPRAATASDPGFDGSIVNRIRLARLNADGTHDSEFYPRIEGNVAAIAVQGDGSILVGGTFASVWGRGLVETARSNVARFTGDGSLDDGFAPTINAAVAAIAPLPDGRVVLGGAFTRVFPRGATTPLLRNRLARLNGDGSFDTSFELDAGGRILASVTQADGRIVVAGSFTSAGGATHNYVARLNADGSVDNSYAPDFNGRVYTLAYDAAANKVIVGGAFTTIGGENRQHIARLNANGTIDSEFFPELDGQVGVVVLQPDGKILVGGSFINVKGFGAATAVQRANLLRLNPNGSLDSAFDPEPNSSVAAIFLQSDSKIVIGGSFTTIQPGGAPTVTTTNGVTTTTISTATITPRNNLARLNADGSLDTTFNPTPNGQVSAIVAQSDGKLILGGAFTALNPEKAPTVTIKNADGTTTTTTVSTRNHIARLTTDGLVDTTYDPNANGNVLALALQSDGKLLVGGAFTTFQPNGAADWTLRKYAARLNTDGTVDSTYNLDISELGGNRVDSVRIQANGTVLLGGSFTSLQPIGSARIARKNFARLTAAGAVDTAFDASTGGSTGAVVNALAVQPDGRVIAAGSFGDLGGARSTNIARYRAEGAADPEFSNSLATDGAINAVVVRPNGAPVPSQLRGLAWLNADGSLRSAFAPVANLSGEVLAVAFDASGRLLVGGTFTDLSNLTGGNLVRFNANGTLDQTFNPAPNGQVAGIVIQPDGRIVIVGAFTSVGGVTRNRIARIDADGALDVTYDPNASGRIAAAVLEPAGTLIVGGAFTSFTPNLAATAVTRNYLARIKADGSIDDYNPTLNGAVAALALQPADGKVVAGGLFTSVQPNGGTTAFTRNFLARLNPDGTLDQNFDPNPNAPVSAVVALAGGQFYLGGSFTTLTPAVTGTSLTRNNLARVNSDGAVDLTFNPNANGAVTSLALQANGALLVGGVFTTLQPAGIAAAIARNRVARLNADGTLDLAFNPDVNGSVNAVVAGPGGTVILAGGFATLQLNASIYVGGLFNAIGGVPAANLAALNDNGSVNATFQPRPNGAVNALLVLPDGRTIAGGAFTTIAGASRNRLARFTADGALDTAYNPGSVGAVRALALQPDGKVLVGGAAGLVRLNADGSADASFAAVSAAPVTAIAVQADGRILYAVNQASLARVLPNGAADGSFAAAAGSVLSLAVQADGRIIVSGSPNRLVRLSASGAVDTAFAPAPNGPVTAVALQDDGRLVVAGGFSAVGGQPRVGIARLAATSPATQQIGVTANRATIIWNRGGTGGDVGAVVFERSADRVTWTRLGEGVRVGGGSADWQINLPAAQALPASGLFYIRARGLAPSAGGTSSGLFESVREFNFANPLAAPASSSVQTPVVASAAPVSPVIDPVTGIAARATVTMVPGEGTVEIFATQALTVAVQPGPRLANLSTRGRVSASSPLILGFAIAGSESRRVLVRAVGPGLTGFGVAEALPATRLQVYNAAGAALAANEGWGGAAELAQAAAATGAFPLAPASADSAAVLTLAPGSYTMHVLDSRGAGGVALAEIYDAGTGDGARLVNVSSRGAAGSGAGALISGFVVAGGAPANNVRRVLLRGVGPGLARFGASGTVADPVISLYDAEGRALGSNDNWVASLPTISAAAASAGAFALDPGSKDAAVLATLPGGAYTVQVSAATAGAALLEIYEVP